MEHILYAISDSNISSIMSIIKPLAILVIGWMISKWLSGALWGFFTKSVFLPKLLKLLDVHMSSKKIGALTTQLIYIILLLFVLVAFFQSIQLGVLSETINGFIAYGLPKLANAVLLTLVAWLLASIAKVALTKIMTKAKVDKKLASGAGSTKTSVTETSSNALYWIIILFFLPQILWALGQQELLKPITHITDQLFGYVPNIISAGVIFVIGLFIAKILKKISYSLLVSLKADHIVDRVGFKGFSLSSIASSVVYAVVVIPVAIQALDKLEIPAISGPATEILNTNDWHTSKHYYCCHYYWCIRYYW